MDISIRFHFGEKEFKRAVEIYAYDWNYSWEALTPKNAILACLCVHLPEEQWESAYALIDALTDEDKEGLLLGFILAARIYFVDLLCERLSLTDE